MCGRIAQRTNVVHNLFSRFLHFAIYANNIFLINPIGNFISRLRVAIKFFILIVSIVKLLIHRSNKISIKFPWSHKNILSSFRCPRYHFFQSPFSILIIINLLYRELRNINNNHKFLSGILLNFCYRNIFFSFPYSPCTISIISILLLQTTLETPSHNAYSIERIHKWNYKKNVEKKANCQS